MSAVQTEIAQTPMERFAALAAEGLEANARRFLRFQGIADGVPIEMQALDIASGRFSENRFAHARGVDEVIRLLGEADRFNAQGVYFIGNAVDPAVATRAESGKWHPMKKGESTTDSEITHRHVFRIDADPVRVPKTSATDAQAADALGVAEAVRRRLLAVLPAAAVGSDMSGNGGGIDIALAAIPEKPVVLGVIKGVLAALDLIFSTEKVSIDTSVCDPKRLVPACGTVKRKGAPKIAAYPHRRSAFTCAEQVERVGLGDLEMLLASLRLDLTDEQNAAVDKAMGKKPQPTNKATSITASANDSAPDPFKRANACAVADVAARLGLMDGDHVKCPGCDTVGDSSVAFVGNGLKCMHARCAAKGKPGGFRTPIDLVMEVRGCSNIEAVRQLGDWFGFEVPKREQPKQETKQKQQPQSEAPKGESVAAGFQSIAIGDVPEDSAVRWLVQGLWTAEGCGVVGGEPKSFKSFLTNHIAVCVASGLPVLNRHPTVKGRVLMFNAEDRPRMTRRRVGRMCRALDLDIATLDLKLIDVPALRLDDAGTVDKLRATVEREKPTLLVLDPLRNLHGLDENDAKIVSALLGPLRLIQRDFGCAVMVVHHLAKAQPDSQRRPGQRLRGSSALHGWLDSALYLTRQASDSIGVVAEHREAAELSTPLAFKLREQVLEAGEALWLEPVEVEKTDSGGDDEKVLNIIRAAETPLAGAAIRKAFGRHNERADAAVKRMAQDGRLVMNKYDGLDAMGRKHVYQGWQVADAR